MGVRRFEDIQAWQEARIWIKQVYAAFDAGYITLEVFKTTYEQANKTKAMVSAFKSSLHRRN